MKPEWFKRERPKVKKGLIQWKEIREGWNVLKVRKYLPEILAQLEDSGVWTDPYSNKKYGEEKFGSVTHIRFVKVGESDETYRERDD